MNLWPGFGGPKRPPGTRTPLQQSQAAELAASRNFPELTGGRFRSLTPQVLRKHVESQPIPEDISIPESRKRTASQQKAKGRRSTILTSGRGVDGAQLGNIARPRGASLLGG